MKSLSKAVINNKLDNVLITRITTINNDIPCTYNIYADPVSKKVGSKCLERGGFGSGLKIMAQNPSEINLFSQYLLKKVLTYQLY